MRTPFPSQSSKEGKFEHTVTLRNGIIKPASCQGMTSNEQMSDRHHSRKREQKRIVKGSACRVILTMRGGGDVGIYE